MADNIVSLGEVHSPAMREICSKRERMYADIQAKLGDTHVEIMRTIENMLSLMRSYLAVKYMASDALTPEELLAANSHLGPLCDIFKHNEYSLFAMLNYLKNEQHFPTRFMTRRQCVITWMESACLVLKHYGIASQIEEPDEKNPDVGRLVSLDYVYKRITNTHREWHKKPQITVWQPGPFGGAVPVEHQPPAPPVTITPQVVDGVAQYVKPIIEGKPTEKALPLRDAAKQLELSYNPPEEEDNDNDPEGQTAP